MPAISEVTELETAAKIIAIIIEVIIFCGTAGLILFVLNKILRVTDYFGICGDGHRAASAQMTFDELKNLYDIDSKVWTIGEKYAVKGRSWEAENRNRVYMTSYKDYLKYYWWRKREYIKESVESDKKQKQKDKSASESARERIMREVLESNETKTV